MPVTFNALCSFIVVAMVVGVVRGEQQESPVDPAVEFRDAESPLDRYDAARELFDEATDGALESMMTDENTDIAVRAAWEAVLRSADLTDRRLPRRGARLPRQRLSWFIGFTEGRLRIRAPAEWNEALLSARAVIVEPPSGVAAVFDTSRVSTLFDEAGNEAREFRLVKKPKTQSLTFEDGGFFLTVGDVKCPVPRDLLNQRLLSAAVSGDRCAIVFPSYATLGESPLVCLDAHSGEVVWQAEVWASIAGGASGIAPDHLAVVSIERETVYIFGAFPGVMYLEAFSLKNGQAVFRLSTDL